MRIIRNKEHPFCFHLPSFPDKLSACTSPSKSFNLAGLQIATIISADEEVRTSLDKAININEVT